MIDDDDDDDDDDDGNRDGDRGSGLVRDRGGELIGVICTVQ